MSAVKTFRPFSIDKNSAVLTVSVLTTPDHISESGGPSVTQPLATSLALRLPSNFTSQAYIKGTDW